MDEGICRLCQEPRALARSHIVPEFMHSDLYDDKHRASVLRPLDGKKWLLQKGRREPLLCTECEQLLNDRFEKPFLNQWRDGPLRPDAVLPGRVHVVQDVDYPRTKLFLLSVLWRAGVSTLSEFAGVKLGPHEEVVRQMLLAEDPGSVTKYPIVGEFAVDEKGDLLSFVSSPIPYRIFGHHAYVFGIGGCEWTYFVSGHAVPEVRGICLQPSGPTFFKASLLDDLRTVKALRGSR